MKAGLHAVGRGFHRCFWSSRGGFLLVLLTLAALMRGFYYGEVMDGPVSSTVSWPQSDMAYFDEWARSLAAGNWLQPQPMHPYHLWHEVVLRRHAEKHGVPELSDSEKRVLWNEWYGGTRFHQEPLYPYLLAMTYAVTDGDYRPMIVLQMLAGMGTVTLFFLIAENLFSPLIARISGLLALFTPQFLAFEVVLLRSSLILFASLALVALSLELARQPRKRLWILLGISSGLALLLKTTLVLLLPVLGVFVFWRGNAPLSKQLPGLALAVMALAACLAPAVIRNFATGAPPFSLSSVSAITFISGNARDAEVSHFAINDHMVPIMEDTGGRFMPVVRETIGTHTPGSLVGLAFKKVRFLFNGRELMNNVNLYFLERNSRMLGVMPVNAYWIIPLGLAGMMLSLRRWRDLFPLYGLCVTSAAVLLAVYVTTRFRMPMIASLIPFASLAVVTIAASVRARSLRAAGRAGLFLLPGLCLVHLPLPEMVEKYWAYDYRESARHYFGPLIEASARAGETGELRKYLEQAISIRPPFLDNLAGPDSLPGPKALEIVKLYGRYYRQYAVVLQMEGEDALASDAQQRANLLQSVAGG